MSRDIHPFDGVKKCPKCATKFDSIFPHKEYDQRFNVMVRTCDQCSYKWIEMCADGSEPNPEIDWNEVTDGS
jgi:C4-type Zn-finger protein